MTDTTEYKQLCPYCGQEKPISHFIIAGGHEIDRCHECLYGDVGGITEYGKTLLSNTIIVLLREVDRLHTENAKLRAELEAGKESQS